MRKLSEKEATNLLKSVAEQLGVESTIIVYGDINKQDLDAFVKPLQDRAKLCQKKFNYLFQLT